MKKFFLPLLLPALVLAASCQRENNESVNAGPAVNVTLEAEIAASRTFIQEESGSWVPYWNCKDTLSVILTTDYSKPFSFINQAEDGRVGQFTGTIEATDGSYTLIAHHPKKDGRAEHNFKFIVPEKQQLPSLSSFDAAADLLVSEPAQLTVSGGSADVDHMTFHRLLAPVRIVMEDATTGGKLAGCSVKGVKLLSSSATLTGRVTVNIDDRSIVSWESSKSYKDVAAVYEGDDWAIDGQDAAYVLVNPVTLPAGSALTLEVTTDDDELKISRTVSLAQDIALPVNEMTTLRFRLEDGDITEPGGEVYTWDFSAENWQAEFKKLGSLNVDISNVNLTVDGLQIKATKGKYRADCWQMAQAGSTEDYYFKFTAPSDGVLKVKASHTGSSPDAEQARRAVTVSNNGEVSSVEAGVPNASPKLCTFTVTAGDVYIYCTLGSLRIYRIEFVTGGGSDPDDPENPDDPDTPGEAEGELDCPDPPVEGDVDPTVMYGYAQTAGVTGGEGAAADHILHFNNGKALQTWLLARTKAEKKGDKSPVIIWMSGTFGPSDGRDFSEGHPWFDVKDVSNISFYGTDGFVLDRIGFFAVRAKNVIFRNINVRQPKANNGADAISIQESDGVWVDHCTFTSLNQTKDYEDGSTDITHGSKNVTVSWCRYIKTQKSCLVGHSNSQSGDTQITVTFHHNWFEDSSSRHPRVRFGRAHVYNNFYDGCTTYGAGSAYGARVLVECNYFDAVQLPTDICTYPAKEGNVSNLQGSVAGYLYATLNEYVNRPANARSPYPLTNVKYTAYNGATISPALTYADFRPAYNYVVTPAADVPALVQEQAGYGKLGWTEAPVPVNNGGIDEYQGSDDDPVNPDPDDPEDPDQPDPPASGLSEGWSWVNNGATASYALADGKLTVSSTGKWESGAQTFGTVYREVSGDFTATVKLDSFAPQKSSNQGVAGLIVFVSDPSATAANLLYLVAGKGDKYYRRYRLGTSGDAAKSTSSAMSAPATTGSSEVFRIVREGNVLKASYSLDGGETFGSASTVDFSGTIGASVKVGVVCNSADNSKQGTAVFSGFTLNDSAVDF